MDVGGIRRSSSEHDQDTFICMYEILKGLVQILRSGVTVLRR